MTRCVMYTRVSSEEQAKEGYSIPYQRQRIREYARWHRLEIRDRFEEAHSAKTTGRPEFQRMLRYLEAHREVRTVLVHKQDRIARNLTDWAYLRETLEVHVIAVEEPLADTPMGRLTQTFGAAMAKFYSDNLSQEVRKGLRQKFEEGGCVTRAPVGYVNVPRGKGTRASVAVDPDLAPLVVRAFERYATGRVSLADLAEELSSWGLRSKTGRPLHPESVRDMLRHPFYKGMVTYAGEVRPGLHEAIVKDDLWDAAQRSLAKRHVDTGEKGSQFFLLRGLLKCSLCGRSFTAERHPRGSYYRCMPDRRIERCPAPLVPVATLDAAVEDILPQIILPAPRRRDILTALDEIAREQSETRAREEQALRGRIDQSGAKILRLAEAFAEGVMPKDDYVALRQKAEAQREDAQTRLHLLTRDLDADIAGVRALLERATLLPDLYALSGTPAERKTLLLEVFGRIYVRDRSIDRIEFKPPFELLLDNPRASGGSRNDLAQALLGQMGERTVAHHLGERS